MSDESKPKEVLIERDGRTTPWGSQSYLRAWNGLKYTLNLDLLQTLLIPLTVLVCGAAYFSGGGRVILGRTDPVAPPEIIGDLPTIDSKILAERDLTNRIGAQRVQSSPMGRIQVFNLRSLTELPVGSEALATLDSGASNGIVKARLTAPMLVDREPLLPEGSILFGHGASTEERLYVEFSKAIFPTGETFQIRAQAFDVSDKILGLKGALVGAKTKKMTAAMLFGFLGGTADGLQDTSGSVFEPQKKSVKDGALAGTAKASLDQSNRYLDQLKNQPEIIEVKHGTDFYVIVDEPHEIRNDSNMKKGRSQ